MAAYYNEWDKYAAQWLRNLIARGLIAPGDVDERSITDVRPDDLRGYEQCHFFAGIGGWSYALRLAGIPDSTPIWTGSCPCQPFSAAGKQRGSEDERHLWPAFFDIIRECRPATVFGEQVAGAAGFAWWDHVAADLEGADYAVAAANLGAHSVGSPHIRQRLYWVADADGEQVDAAAEGRLYAHAGGSSAIGNPWHNLEWLPCSDGKARPTQPGIFPLAHGVSNRVGRLRAYGNAIVPQVAAAFVMANIGFCSRWIGIGSWYRGISDG